MIKTELEQELYRHLKAAVELGNALMLTEDWNSVILKDCNELLNKIEKRKGTNSNVQA